MSKSKMKYKIEEIFPIYNEVIFHFFLDKCLNST